MACISILTGTARILNNTFDNNWRALFTGNSHGVARNNLITTSSESGVYGVWDTLDYNDVWNNGIDYNGGATAGVNSISSDPMYANAGANNYTLLSTSPCIDAGDPDSLYYDLDGSRNDIGALPFTLKSTVLSFTIDGDLSPSNLTNHTPQFDWIYIDPVTSKTQTRYEIQIGADLNWTQYEMWLSGAVIATDTFIVYDGAQLLDGNTYFSRIRIDNGAAWSDWFQTSFRLNSKPSLPLSLSPTDGGYTSNITTLWVGNSIDQENDMLLYEFEGFHDTDCVAGLGINIVGIPEGYDSTGAIITDPMIESCTYSWHARAFDGYEYSGWSDYTTFVVNGSPEAPSAPVPLAPNDTGSLIIYDMLPDFVWNESFDPDPLDSVIYRLELTTNITPAIYDLLTDTSFTVPDSLNFHSHYQWSVTAIDNTGLSTVSTTTPEFWTWTLGDLDYDHEVTVSDLTVLVGVLFQGSTEPLPSYVNDIDGNCDLNVSDLTWMVAYLFKGGPEPGIGCTLVTVKAGTRTFR